MISISQKQPRTSAAHRAGASILYLLLILALCLTVSMGEENCTVEVHEVPPGTTDEHWEELELDRKLKSSFESAGTLLTRYNEERNNLLYLSTDVIENHSKNDSIAGRLEAIEKMKEDIYETIDRVDKRIREINTLQILDLKKKLELLHKRELQRRALMEAKEQFLKHRQEKLESRRERRKLRREKKKLKLKKKQKMTKKKKQGIPEGAIKKDELINFVDVKGLLEEGDKEIEDLFLQIVEAELDSLQGELEDVVVEATQGLDAIEQEEKEKELAATPSDCSGATLTDAVHLIQESLVKFSRDKVGMVDHLARAHVVHHLTSENFVPPAYAYQALDKLWWFHYLPEDWEKGFDAILPEGWRKWNAAIPDYVYHSLGLHSRAATAPPEAILKPSLHPGSCWPMAGQSGQVTLRLPYPVKVKAITLDHAPSLLFEDQTKRQSAPRMVRVFGFPPCWKKKASTGKTSEYLDDYLDDHDDDAEYYRGICDDGLDFDVSNPIVLHDFEYDLKGPSIQTFYIPLAEHEEEAEESNNEDGGEGGSCSETASTCGGGLDGGASNYLFLSQDRSDTINEGVSAVRFEVTDNWGNKDYTCIYRVRIHGDAIDPSED